MKKILLLNMCLIFFASSFVYGQRRKKEKEDASIAQISESGTTSTLQVPTSESFSKTGIYDGQIDPSTRPLRVLPGVFIVPVEIEGAGAAVMKDTVITAFVKGVVVPDYIPDSANNIIAYSIVAELSNKANQAVRFISFDKNIMDLFEGLAFNPEKKPNDIYLYGIEMDIVEASRIMEVSLAPSGESTKTYLLTGVSLKKMERPALVLIASTLLRDATDEIKNVYITPLDGAVRHVKISFLGYEEMKERNQIETHFLPYLSAKEFLCVRSIWVGEPTVKRGLSNGAFRDSKRDLPVRTQEQSKNSRVSSYVPE